MRSALNWEASLIIRPPTCISRKEGYDHQSIEFNVKDNPDHLKWLHTMISNANGFIGGTFHGLAPKHLQSYLNEFCFRTNRRQFEGQLFNRLLAACVSTDTITYQDLTARAMRS
jgi:hypothetical protein